MFRATIHSLMNWHGSRVNLVKRKVLLKFTRHVNPCRFISKSILKAFFNSSLKPFQCDFDHDFYSQYNCFEVCCRGNIGVLSVFYKYIMYFSYKLMPFDASLASQHETHAYVTHGSWCYKWHFIRTIEIHHMVLLSELRMVMMALEHFSFG